MPISCPELAEIKKKSVECKDTNSFTPQTKLWCSLYRFWQNSEWLSCYLQRNLLHLILLKWPGIVETTHTNTFSPLTLNPLTWKIRRAPNNAGRWQMGFNSEIKVLNKGSISPKIFSHNLRFLTTPIPNLIKILSTDWSPILGQGKKRHEDSRTDVFSTYIALIFKFVEEAEEFSFYFAVKTLSALKDNDLTFRHRASSI